MVVVDASVLVGALAAGAAGAAARERLRLAASLHAPHLVDLEVTAALRRLVRLRSLTAEQASGVLDDLGELPLARYEHARLVPRIWSLRENLSPYDASYVALAEVLGATLVTADRRLAGATGVDCAVEWLPR